MRIGTDLDGVLADASIELAKRVSRQYKVDFKPDDAGTLDDRIEEFGIDRKWLTKQFDDEWFWTNSKPVQDNIDTVKKWIEQGHEIHIVTGRDEKTCSIVTRGWLRRQGLVDVHINYSSIMYKVEYLKAKEITIMFEDRFFEANKIGSYGINSFVVRRPWNAQFESRVTNPLVQYVDNLEGADYLIHD